MNEIINFNLPVHVIIAIVVCIIVFIKGISTNIKEAKEYIKKNGAFCFWSDPISVDWYLIATVFLLIWGGFFWW